MTILRSLILLIFGTAAWAELPALEPRAGGAWDAVGRINRAGMVNRGMCSGTLIAPSVVLTAAHCTPQGDLSESLQTRMFVAGWAQGNFADAARIVGGVRHPAYGIGRDHDPRFDLGLIFLERPLEGVTPLALTLPIDAPFALLGYHRGRPHMLSGSLDCPLIRETTDLFNLDCPVVSGNSGGPVLQQDGEGNWGVVAVVSSQVVKTALAVKIANWVRETVEAHRAKAPSP
ncbi:MAG: serine protease [Pseudomonadota bacterium]